MALQAIAAKRRQPIAWDASPRSSSKKTVAAKRRHNPISHDRSMSSTHHGLLIHIIFSTKYRRQLIRDQWRGDLYAYIRGLAKDHKASILSAGGIEDHVHLFAKTHPSFAIADTVKLIKSNSSRWINETGRIGARFEWQRGYGAFSVSQSMSDTIKAYIANQRQHHRSQSFRSEYLEILRRHSIDFDERYVFDEEIIG